MTMPQDPNNSDLRIHQELFGYRIDNILPLPELDGVFYRLTHQATGARHVHISSPDRENTFGVTFKTVPRDSTGVAHILEHTVLCGSKKYPVRDPFFSMLKRSLNTFMNAFTASDWTMYPFSTQNHKDFYNLMDVYLDAAFFPRLDETSFQQEGHRLEIVSDDDKTGARRLAYKGVVFNEMKGAMSSADQVMARSLLNALYPDTTGMYTVTGSYSYTLNADGSIAPDGTGAYWPWPINVAVAPDQQTVIVCNAFSYNAPTSTLYSLGVYQIVSPGVLTFTGVVTELSRAVQSVAFSPGGDKAFLSGNK